MAGTSAGSIVGSLVAAGYSSAELAELMKAIDYREFRDGDVLDHFGVFGKGLSLLFKHGVYEGKYFKRWLGEQLSAKNVSKFADLKLPGPGSSLPSDQQYKLVVMTSDISQVRLRRLAWDYDEYGIAANQEQVGDAVRASMSVPFFYEPVKVKNAAGEKGGSSMAECCRISRSTPLIAPTVDSLGDRPLGSSCQPVPTPSRESPTKSTTPSAWPKR